jgi:hypothetical protein
MAKNIVICCDDTGNEFSGRNSNAINLYKMIICDEGQITYLPSRCRDDGGQEWHSPGLASCGCGSSAWHSATDSQLTSRMRT